MKTTTTARAIGFVAAVALALTACGSAPEEETTEAGGGETAAANSDFTACMVTDSGGVDDKSFNQTTYAGLEAAEEDLGIQTRLLESQTDADYTTNVNSMVQADCGIIVTVGFLLGDATKEAALANPEEKFAIVDFSYGEAEQPANVRSLVFNTAQSSFMAGYLAAGMSQTGRVGTFGGAKLPTVTIFMDGYYEGVQHYNQQKGANVQVLGWDPNIGPDGDGLFTGDFNDRAKGQQTAANLISQGADIIFPVAGPAGLGGLQAAKDSGGNVRAIWVDTDGCVSAPEYCDILLTSVYKAMDLAVQGTVTDAVEDNFTNETYVGTLENEGTGLSPYNQLEDQVPQELKDEVEQVKQDIISGTITVQSKSQPTG